MSRYTKPYSAYSKRIAEVDTLRRLAASKERLDAIKLRAEINALCRGSVVLLSSHLEAYITGKLEKLRWIPFTEARSQEPT